MDAGTLVQQLKALGEPTRLALATRLSRREQGGSELLRALRVSQPSLSRHLKVLREAGIIEERRSGRNAYYRLQENELTHLITALASGIPLRGALAVVENMSKSKYDSDPVTEPPEPAGDPQPRSSDIEEWLL